MATPPPSFEIHPLLHASGARSYVVVEPSSRDALVVDPILEDLGEVLRVLGSRRATLRFVVDTHLHGDHLSAAALLREKTGAEVVMGAAADCRVVTRRVGDGDVLALGETGLRVRAAPGLSPEAIVLQGPDVLFTGDTLLFGGLIILQNTWDCDLTAHLATIRRLGEHPHDGLFPGHLTFSVSDGMRHIRVALAALERGGIPPTL